MLEAAPWEKRRNLWIGRASWPRHADGGNPNRIAGRRESYPGRSRITRGVEEPIVRTVEENCDWRYDRIVGALANPGYVVYDQTVGNVLQRHAPPPAHQRNHTTTWPASISFHSDSSGAAQLAGTDFLTAEPCAGW
jgi:hypothetical protein